MDLSHKACRISKIPSKTIAFLIPNQYITTHSISNAETNNLLHTEPEFFLEPNSNKKKAQHISKQMDNPSM